MRPRPTPTLGSLALTRVLAAARAVVDEQVKQDWTFNYSGRIATASAQEDMDELELALNDFDREQEPKPEPMSVPDAFGLVTSMILKRQAAE